MSGVPQTSYGTPIVLMNMFRGNVQPAYAGCADDVSTGKRWDGPKFELAWDAGDTNPVSLDWQYVEFVFLAGGAVHPVDGQFGDYLDYLIAAPASPAASAPGAGAYAKQEIIPGSGIHRFAPQDGGGWDLDLTAKLNANVKFTAVVPVPNPKQQGFFNWSPATEAVTVAPQGSGQFDLLDKLIPLANFAPKLRVSGSEWQQLLVAGVKPKRLLPHWKHRLRWTVTGGVVSRKLEWTLFIGRERTT